MHWIFQFILSLLYTFFSTSHDGLVYFLCLQLWFSSRIVNSSYSALTWIFSSVLFHFIFGVTYLVWIDCPSLRKNGKWLEMTYNTEKRVEFWFVFLISTASSWANYLLFCNFAGNRPLALGRLKGMKRDVWVVASETGCFPSIGAEIVREVLPGEIVQMNDSGIQSMLIMPRTDRQMGKSPLSHSTSSSSTNSATEDASKVFINFHDPQACGLNILYHIYFSINYLRLVFNLACFYLFFPNHSLGIW